MKRTVLMGLVVVLALAVTAAVVWANADGLVSYWPFDEGSGFTAFDAVSDNDGTIYGATYVPGKSGSALSFAGASYVEVPDSVSLGPARMTLQAWIKPSVYPQTAYARILFKGTNTPFNPLYLLAYDSTGKYMRMGVWIADSAKIARSTTALTDLTKWYHIAGTYDGTAVRIYVDGTLEATTSVPGDGAIDTGTEALGIGRNTEANSYGYKGLIDEVGIWSRPLSEAEIQFLAEPQVAIDIKPGSDPNCFNLNGHGVIPVAILSSAEFDATFVDPDTVSMGGMSIRFKGKGFLAHPEDVNTDGLADLVIQIEDSDGTLTVGDTTATLSGRTYSGLPFFGSDWICMVP